MLYIKDIFFLVLFRICVTEELYTEMNTLMTWEKAKDNCTLATPELVYQGQIPTVKINQNLTNDKNGMWLGYYRNLRGFEYIGCIRYSKDFNIPSKDIENNSPGNCFSACGRVGIIVGLMDQKCYCFGTDTEVDKVVSNSLCDISCSPPAEGLACGGKTSVSLYIVNQKVLQIEKFFQNRNTENNCVRVENDHRLLWDKCDSWLESICKTGQHNFPWNIANNKCFGNNKGHPLTYEDAVNYKVASGVFWTGICRSVSVFSYSEPIVGKAYIEYGYLIQSAASPEKYEIKFTKTMAEKKKSLCRSHKLTAKEHRRDINKSGTAVAIGISVSIISLIIAVVVVCFILRKKKTTLFQCFSVSKNEDVSDSKPNGRTKRNSHENVSSLKTSNSLYNECIASDLEASPMGDNSPHTYFVLEKNEKETRNGIYNVTGPGCVTSIDDRQNNDSRCKLGDSTTYDTVNSSHNSEDNNEYATMENTDAKLKTKKHSCGKSNDFQDSMEDTYNHLNEKLSKKSKTDNLYGIPYQVECSKDDHKSQKKTPQEEGDTYNHIHNKTLREAKTDNVYGIP